MTTRLAIDLLSLFVVAMVFYRVGVKHGRQIERERRGEGT
jgi:hypothetical protein